MNTFKKGDYVECIDDRGYTTVGKVYKVEEIDGRCVRIQNDQGAQVWYIHESLKLVGELIEEERLDDYNRL